MFNIFYTIKILSGAAFITDQDFPSLPGAQAAPPAPRPLVQQPKPAPKQQQPQKRPPQQSMMSDFPSLGSDSGPRKAGSNNLLSNFRPVESAPQFRQLPGSFHSTGYFLYFVL